MGYKRKILRSGNPYGQAITKDTPLKPYQVDILKKIKLTLYGFGDIWVPVSMLMSALDEYPYQSVDAVLKRLVDAKEVNREIFRYCFGDGIFRPKPHICLPDNERKRLDKLFNKDTFLHEQDVIEYLENKRLNSSK